MDYNHIAMLLHVFDKVKEHPNLDKIRQNVLAELKEINDGESEQRKRDREESITKALKQPQRPVHSDGRVDTENDPDVPAESISRNPDGTIRTVKVDPLDELISDAQAPVERRV